MATKKKDTRPKMVKQKVIFTRGHRPFVFGGKVNYILGTKVDCVGPYDLGRGYKGFLISAPNGSTFVAEAETGALVGPTILAVQDDIKTGDPELMKEQVAKAREQAKEIEFTSLDEFWKMLKCEKK